MATTKSGKKAPHKVTLSVDPETAKLIEKHKYLNLSGLFRRAVIDAVIAMEKAKLV